MRDAPSESDDKVAQQHGEAGVRPRLCLINCKAAALIGRPCCRLCALRYHAQSASSAVGSGGKASPFPFCRTAVDMPCAVRDAR